MHRQEWGRFDILGQSFYVAGNVETAYAEVLAGFKLPNGADDPLQEIADMCGVPRETAIEWIAEDWQLLEPDFDGIGVLPVSWRRDRTIYGVETTPRQYRCRRTGGRWRLRPLARPSRRVCPHSLDAHQ